MTTDQLDPTTACPRWCTADHSLFEEEDVYVHLGANEQLTDQITARLVASPHPETGAMEGPYLLVDASDLALDFLELQLDQARTIGEALIDLADRGAHAATVLPIADRPLMSRPIA